MRIISQNGSMDIPYDMVAMKTNVMNDEYYIFVESKLFSERRYLFAAYSTREKYEQAMEMLRNVYLEYEKGMSTEYWFAFNFPKVFQFPQDEDVEV